jgi:hypothetical protein
MATRYPLVLNGGEIEQLQSGDTLEGVAGIPVISEGDGGKVLAVKSDESGAEWVAASSGGVSLGLVIALS